jgi:hypothetical protein
MAMRCRASAMRTGYLGFAVALAFAAAAHADDADLNDMLVKAKSAGVKYW